MAKKKDSKTTSKDLKQKIKEIAKPSIPLGNKEKPVEKSDVKKYPTLKFKSEREIAMDFAQKIYQKFDKLIKSVVLFGSSTKHTTTPGSDIDIIIIIDDASIQFDDKLVVWYREELGNIIRGNPYKKDLHINTIKLTTWWNDLFRGDPVVLNVIRYGDVLLDFGGFFNPFKILLQEGKIKPTPESIYTTLNRVPGHIARSKMAEISGIEGCYWAMVESAQALLMTVKVLPPSPEHIPLLLKEHFVDKKLMKLNYVTDFSEIYEMHRKVMHGEIRDIGGNVIDRWQEKAEIFFQLCMKIIKEII